MVLANFSILAMCLEKLSKLKMNKETSLLNYNVDQMDLTDIYRIFYSVGIE